MVLRVIPSGSSRSTSCAASGAQADRPEERGLILVTGTTGCGKTTTLAAMIDHINATRSSHIVTVEDPIEYLHRDNLLARESARGRDRHALVRRRPFAAPCGRTPT